MAAPSKGGTAAPPAPPAPRPAAGPGPQAGTVSAAPSKGGAGAPTVKAPAGPGPQVGTVSAPAPPPTGTSSKGGTAQKEHDQAAANAALQQLGLTATIPVAGGTEHVQLPPAVTPSIDPRDATYYAARAQELFNINTQKAASTAQDKISQRNYDEALRQLGLQQPKDTQATRESYNKAGLFYSGKLGEALNTLAQNYATKRSGAANTLSDETSARAAARAALDAGYSVQDAADLAAAAERQTGRDQTAAAVGGLPLYQTPAGTTLPTTPNSPGGPAITDPITGQVYQPAQGVAVAPGWQIINGKLVQVAPSKGGSAAP